MLVVPLIQIYRSAAGEPTTTPTPFAINHASSLRSVRVYGRFLGCFERCTLKFVLSEQVQLDGSL